MDCGCNDITKPNLPTSVICNPCSEDTLCSVKMDADCVFYHFLNNKPTKLVNLAISNKTPISDILESIDSLLGTNFNIPISTLNTPSINISASGNANHLLKADVRVSTTSGNSLTINSDGLYVGNNSDDGKVKVNISDLPDYLENQLVGGTDGVISIQTQTADGQIQIQPSINIGNLITTLVSTYPDLFGGTAPQVYTKLAPYVAYEYYGTLSNFDSGGKGIAEKGYDKVYICNGLNGTPDKRGRVAIGANVGVPGGALDAAVNPINNPLYSFSANTKLGEFQHVLTPNENASHTHSANEQSHSHFTFVNLDGDTGDVSATTQPNRAAGLGGNSSYNVKGSTGAATVGKTSSTTPTITVNSSGLGTPHNNTQPSIGAYYYMYIP